MENRYVGVSVQPSLRCLNGVVVTIILWHSLNVSGLWQPLKATQHPLSSIAEKSFGQCIKARRREASNSLDKNLARHDITRQSAARRPTLWQQSRQHSKAHEACQQECENYTHNNMHASSHCTSVRKQRGKTAWYSTTPEQHQEQQQAGGTPTASMPGITRTQQARASSNSSFSRGFGNDVTATKP